jgi:hypothetical protein
MSGSANETPNAGPGEPGEIGSPPRGVADSPWFWIWLFAGWAVLGLVAVAPKYIQRHGRLAVQQQGREEAWRKRVEGRPSGLIQEAVADSEQPLASEREPDAGPDPGRLAPTLLPLLLLFVGVVVVAAVAVRRWSPRAVVVCDSVEPLSNSRAPHHSPAP